MKLRAIIYLKDIFILAITSFGGAQAHLAIMHNILVKKRRYFTEEELLEANALCQVLPGPASTQTIIVLTQKKWNVLMAILALLVWILPACALMTLLVVMFTHLETRSIPTDFFIFVQPLAIGIIAYAGFSLATRLIRNNTSMMIMLLSLLIAASFTTPWTFPLLIIGGAVVTNFSRREITVPASSDERKINWHHSWFSISIFFFVFIATGVLALVTKDRPFILFENFFRFGALTFGGGSVLIPQLFEQFVKHRQYLTANEFLSGLAISQSLPGPSFAFATFIGGMILKHWGDSYTVMGCALGTVAIFLPGALIAFFIFPIWQFINNSVFIRRSLEGINAAAVGLVFSAAVILYGSLEFHMINIFVIVISFLLLQYTKIKAPVLVALALVSGIAYSYL